MPSKSTEQKYFEVVGDLCQILRENQSSWQVARHLRDDEPLPVYGLGASREELIPVSERNERLNFHELLKEPINNPFLMRRRAELGLIDDLGELTELIRYPAEAPRHFAWALADASEPPAGGAPAASVDWRNRWGWL